MFGPPNMSLGAGNPWARAGGVAASVHREHTNRVTETPETNEQKKQKDWLNTPTEWPNKGPTYQPYGLWKEKQKKNIGLTLCKKDWLIRDILTSVVCTISRLISRHRCGDFIRWNVCRFAVPDDHECSLIQGMQEMIQCQKNWRLSMWRKMSRKIGFFCDLKMRVLIFVVIGLFRVVHIWYLK